MATYLRYIGGIPEQIPEFIPGFEFATVASSTEIGGLGPYIWISDEITVEHTVAGGTTHTRLIGGIPQDIPESIPGFEAVGVTDNTVVDHTLGSGDENLTFTEPMGMVDQTAIDAAGVRNRTITDSVGLTEEEDPQMLSVRDVTDNEGLDDLVSFPDGTFRTITDSVGIGDDVSTLSSGNITISDGMGMSSQATPQEIVPGVWNRTINENLKTKDRMDQGSAGKNTGQSWVVEAWDIPGIGSSKVIASVDVIDVTFTSRMSEINGGKIVVPADYPRLNDILDPENGVGTLLQVFIGGTWAYSFFAEHRSDPYESNSARVIDITGPGIESAVGWPVAYPYDYPVSPCVFPDWIWGSSALAGNFENGGFEENEGFDGFEDGTPGRWRSTTSSGFVPPADDVEASEDEARTGTTSLKVEPLAQNSGAENYLSDLEAGKRYVITIWFKNPSADGKRYLAGLQVGDGHTIHHTNGWLADGWALAELNNAAQGTGSANGGWQQFTLDVTIGTSQTSGRVAVYFAGTAPGSDFYLDDISYSGPGLGLKPWVRHVRDGGGVVNTFAQVNNPVSDGNYAAHLQVNSTLANRCGIAQYVKDLIPGSTYTFGIDIRHDGGSPIDIRVNIWRRGGTQIANDVFAVPNDSQFHRYFLEVTTDTDDLDIEIMYGHVGSSPNIYLDNCTFAPGLKPSTAGKILTTLLDDASVDHASEGAPGKPRNTLAWLDYSSITEQHDSDGNTWSDAALSLQITRGTRYHQVLADLVRWGYEWRVIPDGVGGWKLEVFNPTKLGSITGRTVTEGIEIASGSIERFAPLSNHVLGEGSEGVWYEAEETPSKTSFGRREHYIGDMRAYDAATVQSLTEAQLGLFSPVVGVQGTMVWRNDLVPFRDFAVGDTLDLFMPDQGVNAAYRVRSVTAQLSDNIVRFTLGFNADKVEGAAAAEIAISKMLDNLELLALPRITPSGRNSSGGIVDIPAAPDDEVDDTIPSVVTNLSGADGLYLSPLGNLRGYVVLSWSTPLNTDGSAIDDGDYFEVRYRQQGSTYWAFTRVPWEDNLTRIDNLDVGVTYEFHVRAVDTFRNRGPWSAQYDVLVSEDVTPPSKPEAPTIIVLPLQLVIKHNLAKDGDVPFSLEGDIHHLNVYMSETGPGSLTPNESDLVLTLSATQSHLTKQISVIGSIPTENDVKKYLIVTAVDLAGNESNPSDEVSANPIVINAGQLADGAIDQVHLASSLTFIKVVTSFPVSPTIGDVVNLTAAHDPGDGGGVRQPGLWRWDGTRWQPGPGVDSITAGQIAAGAIGADEIAANTILVKHLVVGSFDNLLPNPKFEADSIAGPGDPNQYISGGGGAWTQALTNKRSGTRAARFDVNTQSSVAVIRFQGNSSLPENLIEAAEGDEYAFWGYSRYIDTIPNTLPLLAIRFHDASGATIGSPTTAAWPVSAPYVKQTVTAVAPANTTYVSFEVQVPKGSNADTTALLFDSFYARQRTTGELIVDGSITTDHILVGSLDADRIGVSTLTVGAGGVTLAGNMNANGLVIDADTGKVTIRNLDATEITYGLMHGDRIQAKTIQADRILIGSFENLINNPIFQNGAIGSTEDPHRYTDGTGTWTQSTAAYAGSRSARFNFDGQSSLAQILFNGPGNDLAYHPSAAQGDQFTVRLWARYATANPDQNAELKIQFRDENGSILQTSHSVISGLGLSWAQFEHSDSAPADTAYVLAFVNIPTGNTVGSAGLLLDGVELRQKIKTSYIEDLAVTSAKIESLTASKLTAGTIDASVISVNNLSATQIKSGTLDASLITVANLSASSITTGTLTGRTVQTASSGRRIVLNASSDSVDIYDSAGLSGSLDGSGLAMVLSATDGLYLDGGLDNIFLLSPVSILETNTIRNAAGSSRFSLTSNIVAHNTMVPSSHGGADLGLTGTRWDDLYCFTVFESFPSSESLKQEIKPLKATEFVRDAGDATIRFKWRSDTERGTKYGDGPRAGFSLEKLKVTADRYEVPDLTTESGINRLEMVPWLTAALSDIIKRVEDIEHGR